MGLVSVFAPRRLTGAPVIFSLGNMMASGVLLSAGLVHQLADSAATLNQPGSFPWAMFIAGLTFLLFMVVEESLHLFLGGVDTDDDLNNPLKLHHVLHGEGHSHQHQHTHHRPPIKSHSSGDEKGDNAHDHNHSFHLSNDAANLEMENRQSDESRFSSELQPLFKNLSTYTADTCCSRMNNVSCSSILHGDGLNHSNHSNSTRRASQLGSFLQSTKTHKEDPFVLTDHHHHNEHIDLHLHGSILASGILMLALSIHSILAGLSIGIETKRDSITGTAIAILAHKSFEGFCLGSSLVNAKLDHVPFLVLGIAFSCATPLGIILGEVLRGHVSMMGGGTMIATVQAIVAGTFLYISIVEIGGKELLVCRQELVDGNPQSQKLVESAKLVCFVLGFLAMSALALAT